MKITYFDKIWFDTHNNMEKGCIDDATKYFTKVLPKTVSRNTNIHSGSTDRWTTNCLLLSTKNISLTGLLAPKISSTKTNSEFLVG